MNTRNLIVAGSCAVIALTVGFACIGFERNRRAEDLLRAAIRKNTRIAVEIGTWSERAAAAKRNQTDLELALKQLKARRAFPAGHKNPVAADPAVLAAADPKLRALYLSYYRDGLHFRNLPLYLALDLSPDQINKFENLLASHEDETINLKATAAAQGLAATDPDIAALQKQSDDQLRMAEAQVIGEAGYLELQQYERAVGAWNLVSDVSKLTSYQSNPLSASQEQQLINVVAGASASYQAGGNIDPTTINSAQIVSQSGKFLSPTQLTALSGDVQMAGILALIKQFYQSPAGTK